MKIKFILYIFSFRLIKYYHYLINYFIKDHPELIINFDPIINYLHYLIDYLDWFTKYLIKKKNIKKIPYYNG